MLSKCANAGCPARFRYLHAGKLFRFDTGLESSAAQPNGKATQRVEYFWLCEECAQSLTINYEPGVGMITIPLSEKRVRAVSAS